MANNKRRKKKKPQQQPRKAVMPPGLVPLPGSIMQPFDKNNLPTIGLSIIVKNEANVIERMLKSVAPILDYYCVVDTGSTDGTQEIVKKFFEERGIPGEVIQHEWVNFATARNFALESVKGKADFGFWIDADEELMLHPGFNVDMFKHNLRGKSGANVHIEYGSQRYYRMQFFNTNVPWYWYGPVHEVLICDEPHQTALVEGLHVLVRPDGNSWTSESVQEKYEGHAKILEDYVANDPKKDPRWVFYLAQSYRDAQTPENRKKAMEWYEKRAEMVGGYWEEVYFSRYMIANIKASLGYPEDEIGQDYLRCGKYNRFRVDHLIPVILHLQSKKEWDLAYIYSSHAMKFAGRSPMPQSSLFIDPSIYDWKIYDLHSLGSYYTGRKEEGAEAYKLLKKAINNGLVPEMETKRIIDNEKWFK